MKRSSSSIGQREMTFGEDPKVLFLIDRLHCTEGGAEGAVHKLCRSLPAYGFRCIVATFFAGEGVVQKFPCPVHVIPLTSMYGMNALRCAKDFASLLRRERVKIVHTFFAASDLWGGVLARLSGCPIVISSRRDMGILRSRKHVVLYRFANRLFDQVQAVSNSVREFCVVEDRISADKVLTVYNGVDLGAIDAAVPADRKLCFRADEDQLVISTVANIRQVKGIDILVYAAALVVRQLPNAIFAIIGGAIQEPDYWNAVKASIKQLGLESNFQFLGSRTDVYPLLKQSNAFCLPSRSEGMSNALLEAMACRLPCVATRVGGNPEVVADGVSGFLVSSEDSGALAARLMSLLRDKTLAQRMGQQGRGIVESKFTIDHMAQRLSHLYGDLLQNRGIIPAPVGGSPLHGGQPRASFSSS